MRIPEGCSEADHLGRRITWGIIAGTHEHPEWRSLLIQEWFLSCRFWNRRYMIVLYHYRGFGWGIRLASWSTVRGEGSAVA